MLHVAKVLMNLTLATAGLFISIKVLSFLFDKATEILSNTTHKNRNIVLGIGVILVLAWPLFTSGMSYVLRTSVVVLMYIVLALSLNIVLGFAGQLSIGHAAFYAIGAYTTALMMVSLKTPFWIAFLASIVVSALFGLILGVPTLRLRGDYLAITTIGFGEIVRLVLINWTNITRGPAGIPGIPSPSLFGMIIKTNTSYYYLILGICAVTVFISIRLLKSRLGRGLLAVRDDEIAAEAMGVNSVVLKILAFTLSAAIAGMAGSFFVTFIHYVNPDNFNYMESVVILCMVVLGGVGNIYGVMLGAAVLTILPEALRDISTYRYAIYGLLLMLMMIIRPQGLIDTRKMVKKGGNPIERTRNKIFEKVLWGLNGSK